MTCGFLFYIQVLVSRQDGRLFVHDIIKHEQITELILPAGYEYTPWMPRTFATLDSGSTLFVIGICDVVLAQRVIWRSSLLYEKIIKIRYISSIVSTVNLRSSR